ncbi:cell division protein FtsQ/DivIB [Hydromonas duriensis]|uniref:Cell division protein FtsQ n=1 Tax=Hydromonas duriensis TaxID=1527608 RepID=A0A4V3DJR6_9BURK|nr:cell division protein FtsQ/DivIB [Hydromonas duriensis]TDR30840.1 cell division protein FtsQ [Hydromonas duriensis]
MLNIWQDVDLMAWVARLVMRVALALLALAGVAWLLQRPYFAINQFKFVGDVKQLDEARLRDLLQKNLDSGLAGGFFSMELKEVQNSLKEFSWVKSTSVRRVWPHEIEVSVEAFKPVAVWGSQYLSSDGDVFDASLDEATRRQLLVTQGPLEASKLVAEQIPVFQEWLKPMGWSLRSLTLSERYSWRLGLSNGLQIEFGRADTPTVLQERATRLMQSAAFIKGNMKSGEGGYIDLRYPNGFAMRTDELHRVASVTNVNNTGEKK